MSVDHEKFQREVCGRYGAAYCPSMNSLKTGVSVNLQSGLMPLNGLRHTPEHDTTGWYIWAGTELRQESDFFRAVHTYHLFESSPSIVKYLGLPPGWRFLVDDDYEDVWFDESLLRCEE